MHPKRLRYDDLERPFHGVRTRRPEPALERADEGDRYAAERAEALARARAYAARMHPAEFFSHATAAHLWGAPVPAGGGLELHVTTHRPGRAPRARGVVGHEALRRMADVTRVGGLPVTTPATTWAMMGHLAVDDLVALGDHVVRVWREGYFRPDAGRPPLATIAELRAAMAAGRRLGASRLREAVELIREDSWSPKESKTRCLLGRAGLPEPELNVDVFDRFGAHLGCLDIAYPGFKVAVEYQGMLHGERYARDVDRIEALRDAGWIVIQVTWTLLHERPAELVRRVSAALRSRGWRP